MIMIQSKAICKLSKRDIERRYLKAAASAMSKHISAISKCIDLSSKNIDKSLPLH